MPIKSELLYKDCVADSSKMRIMWDHFKPSDHLNHLLNTNNSFSNYMNFMYDNYPSGFGNEIMKCYNENKIWYGSNLYDKLV